MNGVKKMFKNYSKGYYPNQYKYNFTKNNPNYKKDNKPIKKSFNTEILNGELQYIKTIEEHNQSINNIIYLENLKYITSDNNDFYIRTLEENNETLKENFGNNAKIHKIIYSSGKIIFSVEYINEINGNEEKRISHKLHLAINTKNKIQLFSCIINDNPNEILESDNVIIIAGKSNLELFQFNQNNNNNQILKVSEIKINNNENNDYQILSMKLFGKSLICGHSSGHISFWKPINDNPYLENISISRIHIGPINDIIFDKNSDNIDILISCSSDKTLKVHSIEDTICFNVIDFEEEAIAIKKVFNSDNAPFYIISLKNGILKVFNALFKEIFEIPNRSNMNTIRFVISINNSNNNNENTNKENYLLISEENKIDIYKWNKKEEKEEEKKVEINKSYEKNQNSYYNKKFYGKKWNNKSNFYY